MLLRVFVFSPKFVYYTSRARTLSTVFYCQGERQVNGRVALFNGSVERVIGRITPFSGLDLRILLFSLLNCHPGSVLRTLLPTT